MAPKLDNVRVVLLDIEGTVCPISFVKDVLYPYAVNALPAALDKQWDNPDFAVYRDAFPAEYASDRTAIEAHFRDLVSRDVKASYLKALQGYLWKEGYKSGEIKAPLFPDVAERLQSWKDAGLRLVIYSSGSVPAQKLFFGYTDAQPADLTPLISGWFDTVNAGLKTEAASYAKILSNFDDTGPEEWLFLSDNPHEVSAAIAAGMQSIPVVRPGNAALPADLSPALQPITDFNELKGLGSEN
ncbi:Enolase-phosphatase E1 [Colletotrichum chlorophyti]|uniref:Enolase-phosphatase E1 n=1 Tax=Colletotrichum chlorophyti TaxID=708187 RepID=A0A1Q8RB12_9PEZI|nr:Enolase-phosphatase E1 [Colletotrichum chlorophyti]